MNSVDIFCTGKISVLLENFITQINFDVLRSPSRTLFSQWLIGDANRRGQHWITTWKCSISNVERLFIYLFCSMRRGLFWILDRTCENKRYRHAPPQQVCVCVCVLIGFVQKTWVPLQSGECVDEKTTSKGFLDHLIFPRTAIASPPGFPFLQWSIRKHYTRTLRFRRLRNVFLRCFCNASMESSAHL